MLFKVLIGAGLTLAMALFAKSRNFFVAGVLPLFPTFAILAYYFIGQERTVAELKTVVLFTMYALLPYLGYLTAMYVLLGRYSLNQSLIYAAVVWFVLAIPMAFYLK
jgi:membrane protein GlpM